MIAVTIVNNEQCFVHECKNILMDDEKIRLIGIDEMPGVDLIYDKHDVKGVTIVDINYMKYLRSVKHE